MGEAFDIRAYLEIWLRWKGTVPALAWAVGDYVVWALVLAWLLARRENELRSELGL